MLPCFLSRKRAFIKCKLLFDKGFINLQKQHVDIWMGRLKEDLSKLAAARQGVEAMDTGEGTSEPSSGAAPPAVAALLDSLEALRELGGTHFTSQLMHSSQIVPFLQELKSHEASSFLSYFYS